MIPRYAVLASCIRQDVAELGLVVDRVERAMRAYQQETAGRELFLDSAALNLHDFYTGLERIFSHIASGVDQSVPAGPDWRREVLRQMTIEVPGLRPQVLSAEVAGEVDEFLRFRHVVRHNYAFALEPARVKRLASRLRPASVNVRTALLAFATHVESLAHEG